MDLSRRNFIFRILSPIAMLIIGFVGGLFIKKSHVPKSPALQPKKSLPIQDKNPYEYDLSSLREVDPRLVTYQEIAHYKIDLQELTGIATDESGRFYVSGDKAVLGFQADGKPFLKVDLPQSPHCLTVAKDQIIYVGFRDYVVSYSMDGTKQQEFGNFGESAYITSLAVSSSSIFIADAGNRIVWRFDKSGKLLGKIGEKNKQKGIIGLIVPSPFLDIALVDENSLWVVNPGQHSLEKYHTNGELITSWTKTSMQIDGFCGCCNPTNIALLKNGALVTSEKGIERVKIHEPNGDFRAMVATPSQFKEGTVGLDLAVDLNDRILVLDPSQKAVRIFSKK
jgi:sugar lactone lactonase YvrE